MILLPHCGRSSNKQTHNTPPLRHFAVALAQNLENGKEGDGK